GFEAASSDVVPPLLVPATTRSTASRTDSRRCFSALDTMHFWRLGSDCHWSTSTPMPQTLASHAASRKPAPVRPATWKSTSAFWPIICCPTDLPPAESLNALLMSVEKYWLRTFTLGFVAFAPFS